MRIAAKKENTPSLVKEGRMTVGSSHVLHERRVKDIRGSNQAGHSAALFRVGIQGTAKLPVLIGPKGPHTRQSVHSVVREH
jgi:hypothetical protein